MKYEIANPDPAGTIESFRSLGYTIEAAVADLVDNCITAQARHVNVSSPGMAGTLGRGHR